MVGEKLITILLDVIFKITMTSSVSRLLNDKKSLKFYQRSTNGSLEFHAWQKGDSIHRWEASFNCETMFADNNIKIEIVFPMNYPFIGPSIKINTPFKHDCIDENGNFNVFNDCWSPAYSLGAIILMIKSYLSEDICEFNRQKWRTEIYKSELIIKCHRRSDY
jgi:ubiquitin-protein ligase